MDILKPLPKKNVLVLLDTATGWGRGIIRGIAKFAKESGDWSLSFQPRGQSMHLAFPKHWHGDGVIARIATTRALETLKATGLPVVNVSSLRLDNCPFPRVVSEFSKVGEMSARHLLDCGFKHFAFCASEFTYRAMVETRESFVNRLWENGASCNFLKLSDNDFLTDQDQQKVLQWLKAQPKPLAVFAMSVSAPFALVSACQAAGIAIPEEVAILSSASVDELVLQVIEPPVSCVVTADTRIGYEAAKRLDRMMRGESKAMLGDITLIDPSHIEIRGSSDIMQTPDEAVRKAIRFIRENASRGIQVPDVAAHAGLSRKSLELRMKRAIHRSPAEEIRQVRLDIAIKLLTETNLPIPIAGERAGFGTTEHFIVFFKEKTGYTPLQYAKRYSQPAELKEKA